MQHVGHRRVDPLHAGAAACGPVSGAVGEFAACGAGIAKGFEVCADLLAREGRVVAHASLPVGWPAQRVHQFARQAKGQIKSSYPIGVLVEPIGESIQAGYTLQ